MGIEFIESDLSRVIDDINRTNTIGLDFETTGLSPIDSRILLCQVGTPENQWVINVANTKLDPLLPYLSSHKWKKIIQNAKFESKFVQYFYNTKVNNVWDTFIAESVLYPDGHSNGLEAIALKYLDRQLDKTTRKSFFNKRKSEFSEKQIAYAAEDVEVLFPIMEAQRAKAKELSLISILDMEFELSGIVAAMENTGVPIDVALWKKKYQHFADLHEQSRLRMHEILFDDGGMDEQLGMFRRDALNMNSPQKIKAAFKKLGIDVDTTSEREISLLKHPAARELLEYRGLQKIMTSYGKSFLDKVHPFTGLMHPDFQQMGTETGRFSCKDPNMQQLPEEFHECITKEGYSVVGADYSQIELRILAQFSEDSNMIKAFDSGLDLHSSTASMMFGIPVDKVSKPQRFSAKTLNFGISYGMGVKKLQDSLNTEAYKNGTPSINFAQAREMVNKYYRTYRRATDWLQENGALAYRQGYSETAFGRKRFYTRPNINDLPQKEFENQVAAIRRKGSNSIIQGTCADMVKLAMIKVHNELYDAGYKANMILQVHDEIVVLARNDQAEAVKSVIAESMKQCAEQMLTKIPAKVDAYVSDAWRKN